MLPDVYDEFVIVDPLPAVVSGTEIGLTHEAYRRNCDHSQGKQASKQNQQAQLLPYWYPHVGETLSGSEEGDTQRVITVFFLVVQPPPSVSGRNVAGSEFRRV